jgi:hypothetical protein
LLPPSSFRFERNVGPFPLHADPPLFCCEDELPGGTGFVFTFASEKPETGEEELKNGKRGLLIILLKKVFISCCLLIWIADAGLLR